MLKGFFIPTKSNGYQPILLRKIALTFYTIILILVNSFGGLVGIPEVMASSITPDNLINLTNQQRTAAGLNSLSNNAALTAAAQAKANNMFQEQYWDHFGPNGESPWMFISQAGYKYIYAGENLAKGFKTAEGVHEAWMASPTHKENIMSGNYKDIGIAVVEGTLLGKKTILVVQMFGNLTTQTVKAQTVTPSGEVKQRATISESGQIKSISITNPKTGDLINNANIDIEGETKNVSGEYTVQILDNGEEVGEVKSNSELWKYDKESDWQEGERKISAQIKGENVKSDTVNFTVDSTPPTLNKNTIAVKRSETDFTLSFKVPQDSKTTTFVTGDKTFILTPNEQGYAENIIAKSDTGDRSLILLSDEAGNISEYDISEYFIDGDESSINTSSFILWMRNTIGTTDGISLAIILFVFILLSMQVYVSWRRKVLGKNAGSLFTIGAWWLIILVGAFKGFGGIIN